MSSIRLELANPEGYSSVKDYVEKHLVPVVSELHRLTNEMMTPGSTSEAYAVDMSTEVPGPIWQNLDTPINQVGKYADFDGSEYFALPKELLKAKQVKVQFVAQCYVRKTDDIFQLGGVDFRLVDDDNDAIEGSQFTTLAPHPATISLRLPFSDSRHHIRPSKRRYWLQARSHSQVVQPVCRRFSLSFIYL